MDSLSAWYAITVLGTPEYWAYLSLILVAVYFVLRQAIPQNPFWKKYKPIFRRFLLILIPSLFIFLGLALVIKTFWFLERPCTVCIGDAVPAGCNTYCLADSSFPSGHSGTAFVMFASLCLAIRKKATLFLLPIPLLISYSRLALGVHYPSDLVGGALLGLLMPILASIIIQKKHKPT